MKITIMLLSFIFTNGLISLEKQQEEFRIYDASTDDHVREFYRQNHKNQTLEFVLEKKAYYSKREPKKMTIWEALDFFDQIIDESDPDLSLPQRYHLFQTAEAIRKDGHPDWFILTGLIHDLGKILTLFGEPQWAVVGDTFPLGCAFSNKIVFSEYFQENPDRLNKDFQTLHGIYEPGIGFDNLHMSFGHDEYLYNVVKDYLPKEALYIIRFHSFYAAHREGAYEHLMSEDDRELIKWLKKFSFYDLYSKSEEKLDLEALMPYYKDLVYKYFKDELSW